MYLSISFDSTVEISRSQVTAQVTAELDNGLVFDLDKLFSVHTKELKITLKVVQQLDKFLTTSYFHLCLEWLAGFWAFGNPN